MAEQRSEDSDGSGLFLVEFPWRSMQCWGVVFSHDTQTETWRHGQVANVSMNRIKLNGLAVSQPNNGHNFTPSTNERDPRVDLVVSQPHFGGIRTSPWVEPHHLGKTGTSSSPA